MSDVQAVCNGYAGIINQPAKFSFPSRPALQCVLTARNRGGIVVEKEADKHKACKKFQNWGLNVFLLISKAAVIF
jgi:hypothetical protein